jgi:2-keto-4-pentenoate hydratase/2-oxohepta-3-ene-1,7-dioic acid hydratase in catechol pathway
MDNNNHQEHLKELFSQRENIQTELNNMQNEMTSKRDMLLKIQGAIEYLTQTGVTLEKVEQENLQEEEVEV